MAFGVLEHERMDSAYPGLTVACVCVPGGIYNSKHVARLHDLVASHLSQPFIWHCIIASPWPGWWAKVELFKPGRFHGRVLYLDLDVSIVGSLDDLVSWPSSFVIIDEWQKPGRMYNSSVMVWNAGVADHIYTNFTPEVMRRFKGDQGWIHEQMPDADTFPKQWCKSYKRHVLPRLDGSLPEDCRVIVYHGEPKPWDLG